MGITDELREYANTRISPNKGMLTAIADRIDAEHERLMQEQPFTIDMVPMTDENMAEHGWVRLPKDADGKYIRIGDVLTDDAESKSEGKVMRLMLEDDGWSVGLECGWWAEPPLHEWRHYHEPTVEDVLREFTDAILEWAGKSGTVAEVGTWSDVAADFDDKLRLADDGKER